MNEHITKDNLIRFASNINIGYIIRFHLFILDELRRKEDYLDHAIATFEGNHEDEIDLRVERNLYASIYKHQMISNTFLMLYSHLEEWLYLVWQAYGNSVELGGQGKGSIARFKPVFQNVLNVDISKDENWQFLTESETVRNCLLHANARIDLSMKQKELHDLIRKRKGLLYEKNSRLYVNQRYVEKFFECVQYIILKVESSDKT